MLTGFPKKVKTTKISRGHYRIDREDGYSIEVRASCSGDWYQLGNMHREQRLNIFKYDMAHGFTAHDQLKAYLGE